MDSSNYQPNVEDEQSSLNHDVFSSEITTFELAYKHYDSIWKCGQQELQSLLDTESSPDKPKAVANKATAVRQASVLYLQYIRVSNKLIHSLNHIAQPQKRRYLRKVVDNCIGRVLELKHELVSLENTDFQFMDQTLLTLGMGPQDMYVRIPDYYKESNEGIVSENKAVVQNYLSNQVETFDESIVVPKEEKYVRMAAVFLRMIQAHERARQSRQSFHEAQKRQTLKELRKQKERRKHMEFMKSKKDYAIVIQKAWRIFLFRRRMHDCLSMEFEFLKDSPTGNSNNIAHDVERDRLLIIERNESEYVTARRMLKQEMLLYSAPRIYEDLVEKIRKYFDDYKEYHDEYPAFPPDEEGGSTALLSIPVEPPEESESEVEVDKKEKEAKEDKSKKGKKNEKDKKGPDEDAEENGYSLTPSRYVPALMEHMQEFSTVWAGRKASGYDRFDEDLMKIEVEAEVRDMVRVDVDQQMREELAKLEKAVRKDSKKKGKKGKKDKEKKGKKGEKDKKKKEKEEEEDMTADRDLDSLLKELIENGIIRNYPKVLLEDFMGEYNYSGSHEFKSSDLDPLPCLGDIMRVINEYCILPMGSEGVHSGGAYVKSILIVGPKGSGKKFLIHAVCNEIGATMMDLSAKNTEGKYAGEEGLDMLLHLVSKVSRLVQPTVIYVEDAENYFWQKKPATSQLKESGRLKKRLPKLIKKIGDMDRVIVCGASDMPFDADQKGLDDCYDKILCILKPDYNCRSHIWRHMITKYQGDITKDLHLNVLSNVSDGFTAAAIEGAVEMVMTHRRLALQAKVPLCATDFVSALAEFVPVYEEEQEAYKLWMQKTTLGKKRADMLKAEQEEEEEGEEEEVDDY